MTGSGRSIKSTPSRTLITFAIILTTISIPLLGAEAYRYFVITLGFITLIIYYSARVTGDVNPRTRTSASTSTAIQNPPDTQAILREARCASLLEYSPLNPPARRLTQASLSFLDHGQLIELLLSQSPSITKIELAAPALRSDGMVSLLGLTSPSLHCGNQDLLIDSVTRTLDSQPSREDPGQDPEPEDYGSATKSEVESLTDEFDDECEPEDVREPENHRKHDEEQESGCGARKRTWVADPKKAFLRRPWQSLQT